MIEIGTIVSNKLSWATYYGIVIDQVKSLRWFDKDGDPVYAALQLPKCVGNRPTIVSSLDVPFRKDSQGWRLLNKVGAKESKEESNKRQRRLATTTMDSKSSEDAATDSDPDAATTDSDSDAASTDSDSDPEATAADPGALHEKISALKAEISERDEKISALENKLSNAKQETTRIIKRYEDGFKRIPEMKRKIENLAIIVRNRGQSTNDAPAAGPSSLAAATETTVAVAAQRCPKKAAAAAAVSAKKRKSISDNSDNSSDAPLPSRPCCNPDHEENLGQNADEEGVKTTVDASISYTLGGQLLDGIALSHVYPDNSQAFEDEVWKFKTEGNICKMCVETHRQRKDRRLIPLTLTGDTLKAHVAFCFMCYDALAYLSDKRDGGKKFQEFRCDNIVCKACEQKLTSDDQIVRSIKIALDKMISAEMSDTDDGITVRRGTKKTLHIVAATQDNLGNVLSNYEADDGKIRIVVNSGPGKSKDDDDDDGVYRRAKTVFIVRDLVSLLVRLDDGQIPANCRRLILVRLHDDSHEEDKDDYYEMDEAVRAPADYLSNVYKKKASKKEPPQNRKEHAAYDRICTTDVSALERLNKTLERLNKIKPANAKPAAKALKHVLENVERRMCLGSRP